MYFDIGFLVIHIFKLHYFNQSYLVEYIVGTVRAPDIIIVIPKNSCEKKFFNPQIDIIPSDEWGDSPVSQFLIMKY